ncbi:FKBP-type peptidyl-prolyl cis-trans isomerase [Herbiconiux liukaitaii]|uniref:FKBP-type peptidyl-prolyl cis-trans isomerase n=1 Tax=Herbiconiux liukaitaii TaxID=3342799 RepID=UPI0035B89ABB
MRKSLALTLSAGLLVALAGCSGAPAAPDCSKVTPSGDASSIVTATGEAGADPQASFPFPLTVDEAQSSVLIEGEGDPIGIGGTIAGSYTIYDGESGQPAGATQATALVVSDGLPEGLRDALLCSTSGQRTVVVLPNDEASQIVDGAPGSIVMVFDVSAAFPQAADGADQPATSGFPGVVHAPDGRPGITIGAQTAPEEAKSALLKKGDGAEVAEGDTVVVQSTAVSYSTRAVTSSTWEDGSPAVWTMSDDEAAASASQPAGISEFLVGQKVGSEVIVVIPDGSGSATAYVVDIVGVLPAS